MGGGTGVAVWEDGGWGRPGREGGVLRQQRLSYCSSVKESRFCSICSAFSVLSQFSEQILNGLSRICSLPLPTI